MSTLGEVEAGVRRLERAGTKDIAILHCVSDYPANPSSTNLRAMETLKFAFGRPVGWSDHTLGDVVAIAAVARGARIIEKHLTLDCNLPGPDHKASLEPADFSSMVGKIRTVQSALGDGQKRPTEAEVAVRIVARRSVFSAREIAKDAVVRKEDLAFLRPGTGISPMEAERLLGHKSKQTIPAGTLLHFYMFE
jgi:N-acetylneuraminate synthase/N,N'-diacetyllegionaminate synthase